jgi:hypothetical protein
MESRFFWGVFLLGISPIDKHTLQLYPNYKIACWDNKSIMQEAIFA